MIKLKKHKELPDFWKRYEKGFSKKLPSSIQENTFVVWDTETTGFKHDQDRILCIGAIKLRHKTLMIKDSFEIFLAQNYFDIESVEIHGILKKEKKECVAELDALEHFLDYVGNSILVGHHVGFDVAMVNQALKRNGIPLLKNSTLDTSLLYKRTLLSTPLLEKKDHYSLDELAEKFSISKKDRHTALGDALITAIAFLEILERLKPKDLKALFKMERPSPFRIW